MLPEPDLKPERENAPRLTKAWEVCIRLLIPIKITPLLQALILATIKPIRADKQMKLFKKTGFISCTQQKQKHSRT
jgi:hypothetical protein